MNSYSNFDSVSSGYLVLCIHHFLASADDVKQVNMSYNLSTWKVSFTLFYVAAYVMGIHSVLFRRWRATSCKRIKLSHNDAPQSKRILKGRAPTMTQQNWRGSLYILQSSLAKNMPINWRVCNRQTILLVAQRSDHVYNSPKPNAVVWSYSKQTWRGHTY